jgi:hypothetical protein
MRKKLNQDWEYDIEKDRYIHSSGVEVSGLVLQGRLAKLNRKNIYEVHILAVLDKMLKEFH